MDKITNKIIENQKISFQLFIEDNRIKSSTIFSKFSDKKLEFSKKQNGDNFKLIIEEENGIEVLNISNFKIDEIIERDENKTLEIILSSLHRLDLRVIILYKLENEQSILSKSIIIENYTEKSIHLLEICVISEYFDSIFWRGGIGQPIFIPCFFFALSWPTAENIYDGKKMELWHFPDIDIKTNQSFLSEKAIHGLTNKNMEEDFFLKYITKNSRRKKNEIFYYFSDWAAHDEISGSKTLDESMAIRLASILNKWREKKNLRIDYYLLDIFWYEKTSDNPYFEWNKTYWPNGPSKFLKLLKEYSLKLGLWIDPTGLEIIRKFQRGIIDDALEIVNRIYGPLSTLASNKFIINLLRKIFNLLGSRKKTVPCLLHGDYKQKLEKALNHYVNECDLELIKLDFTKFRCNNEFHSHKPGKYAEERSIRVLLNILRKLERINPKLKVIAYNGFTKHQGYVEQPTYLEKNYPISPFWAIFLDMFYIGDPRLSEIPTPTLRSSISCYSDTQFRTFHKSLMPLQSLDDHSVLIGDTETVMNLKARDWTDAWILSNLSRGHLNFMLYGEISFLDNEKDLEFLLECQRFLENEKEICSKPIFIGGKPHLGEIYGTMLGPNYQNLTYIIIHNPSFISKFFNLRDLTRERSNSNLMNAVQLYPKLEKIDKYDLKIAPSEVKLIQIGSIELKYNFNYSIRYIDGFELHSYNENYIRSGNHRIIKSTIRIPEVGKNKSLFIVFSFKQSIYFYREFYSPKKQFSFKIQNISEDMEIINFEIIPEEALMGGTSWVVYKVNLKNIAKNSILIYKFNFPWKKLVLVENKHYILTHGDRK